MRESGEESKREGGTDPAVSREGAIVVCDDRHGGGHDGAQCEKEGHSVGDAVAREHDDRHHRHLEPEHQKYQPAAERDFFVGNRLVRIHLIIEMPHPQATPSEILRYGPRNAVRRLSPLRVFVCKKKGGYLRILA